MSIIGSDKAITNELAEVMDAVLDAMIPANSDGRPSAADIGLREKLHEMPGPMLVSLAGELTRVVEEAPDFCQLSVEDRLSVLTPLRQQVPRFLENLAGFASSHYYRNDLVLEAIGMGARAPFPEGYEVEPGDLSLLDPVKARGQVYRDI